MMLRHSLLIGVALTSAAGTAHAQSRSREDLLDQLTRHIQICAEITDNQQRLACYDKVQTDVGDVQAPARQPTPIASNPPPPSPPPQAPPPSGPSSGGSYGVTPLSPPPLGVPGGGVATIGGSQPSAPEPPSSDPDRAFNPNAAGPGYGAAGGARPQPQIRRTGARPIPYSSQPMPLVTLTASNLTYGEAHYWQVSVSATSNTPNTVDTKIQCTFRNAGRSVGEAYLGPVALAPGEQISTELYGPPTTTYVDSTNCRVLSP